MKAVVLDLLARSELPRDALPYTDQFTEIKKKYESRTGESLPDAEFWKLISHIGKYGGAGKKTGRKQAPRTPSLTEEQQLEVLRLLPDGTGKRDDLPYTKQFDDLHRQFNRLTLSKLTKHEFWRCLSRVAKLSRKPKPVFEVAPEGGLSPALVQMLERINPWWRGQPQRVTESYRRWAFDEVMDRLGSEIAPVIAVRGPRQVGKTTIQDQVIEHLLRIAKIDPRRIFRVQFDMIPGLGAIANPVEAVVRWYEENVLQDSLNAFARRKQKAYLLFDELQNLAGWSDQLKSLVDHTTAHFFVTGSSALRIAKGSDSLAGRISSLELGPLRLGEVLGIRKEGNLEPFASQILFEDWRERDFWLELVAYGRKNKRLRDKAFRYFSKLGGYPRCHVSKSDIGLLRQQIVDAVVRKTIESDATAHGNVSLDTRTLREVFRMTCRYAGNAVRSSRIAEELDAIVGGVSAKGVEEALNFLSNSLLIHRIQPLEMLGKKHTSPPKLCICDHFVRNGVLQETVPLIQSELDDSSEAVATQAGHVIESIVGYYLRGLPGTDIAWFPKRAKEPEIDFVITVGTRRIPMEIKYRRKVNANEHCAGIASFCEKPHYEAPFGLVITRNTEGPIGKHAIAIPAATFLLLR